jgi:outer membrane protein OmpA-like peptidoglycan-associated protein
MKYLLQILIVLLSIVTTTSFSQNDKVEKGNKDFDQFAYIDSREIYLKVVEKGYQSQDIFQKLGDSYYFNADLNNAATWYSALIDTYGETVDSEYYFRYSQSLKSLEQYSKADDIMDRLYEMKETDDRAQLFHGERNYLTLIDLQSGRYELSDLSINSELSDFAPSFYLGNLVFASNKESRGVSKNIHEWNNEPFLDLYIMGDNENGVPKKLSGKLNTKFHESTATFNKEGTTVYFTRNNYTKNKYQKDSNGANLLKLYRSTKGENGWSEAEELPFNSNEYSVAHPALSEDEKTLYFASNMPGGEGLSDLYSVSIEGDGFGEPKSLGDVINTEGRETFPFVAANGDLYFSSDGHPGLGGLDVYVVDKNEEGNYGEGYNVGAPVNSPSDDFTFIINTTSGLGYFASNRDGGAGGDDIYSFKQITPPIKKCYQSLNGTIRNKENDKIIAGANVVFVDGDNNVISEAKSDENGFFDFGEIECGTDYALRANMEEFDPSEVSFSTSKELSAKVNKTLYLTPRIKLEIGADLSEILDLNPIYFDLDKSFIRPDAEVELQKVIAVMNEYPNLKIDVRSHTDSRGNDLYNMKLSQRRNESTILYIKEKGNISEDRITGKGYGESVLLNNCGNGSVCSEVDHQLNRRSEFIIIEK